MKTLNHSQVIEFISSSSEETRAYARSLGEHIKKNFTNQTTIIVLKGDLGAGKTTFTQGLVEGVQKTKARHVCSPTFSLLNIYEGSPPIYHFDLYRLPRLEEFIAAGFYEYLEKEGICCIEWAEKILPLLTQDIIHIDIAYLTEDKRSINTNLKS